MEQHLGRQLGVQKVEVSLDSGEVKITPKNDGRIDPVQILKATYDSGVSVAEMSMIARGQIIKSPSGEIVFQVQPTQSFLITPNDVSRELENMVGSGATVTIRGLLYTKPADKKKHPAPSSLSLSVLEILKE